MGDSKRVEIILSGDPSGLKKAALEAAVAIDKLQASGDRLTATAKSNTEAANRFVERMKEEAVQLAAGDLALRKYQISKLGLTEAALKEANALADSIEQLKEHERAARRAGEGQENLTGSVIKGTVVVEAATRVFQKLVDTYGEMKKVTAEAQQIELRTEAVLRASGEAAGGKREMIDRLAKSMAVLTRFDDDTVKSTAQQVLTLGLANDKFERAIKLGADLAVTYNRDLTGATMTLAKALVEPGEALGGIERMMGKFDPAIKKQIKNFVDMNEAGKAADLILNEVARVAGVAEGAYSGLDRTTRGTAKAWDDLLKAMGNSLFDKHNTDAGLLEKSLRSMTNLIESDIPTWEKAATLLMALANPTQAALMLAKANAEAANKKPEVAFTSAGSTRADLVKPQPGADSDESKKAKDALNLLQEMGVKYQTANQKMAAELAIFKKLVADTGRAESEFADIEAGIRAKYAVKGDNRAENEARKEAERLQKNRMANLKAEQEAQDEFTASQGKQLESESKIELALRDSNEALRTEIAAIGLNRIERELLLNTKAKEIALSKVQDAAIRANITAMYDQRAALLSQRGTANDTDTARKELEAFLDPAKAKSFGETLSGSFGKAATSLVKLTRVLEDYGIKQAEIAKQRANLDKLDKPAERAAEELRLNELTTKAKLGSYGDMASAAAGFFDEHSKGYRSLMAVSQVFHAAELAMTLAELVPKAISAVLTQGQGDPYTAFGRMAAMAAIVAGLGVAVGGGGGGGVNTDAKDRQAAAGTGSTLGDTSAKSASISRSLDMLTKSSVIGNDYLSSMTASLRNIETNIGGLAALVVRSVGLTGADTSGMNLGTSKNLNVPKWLDPLGIVGSLFGKTTRTLTDSGIQFNAQTIGQARQGVSALSYADITTNKSSLFGLIKSSSTSRETSALSAEITGQFTLIINNLFKSILDTAKIFGSDVGAITKVLDGLNIDLTNISFKGLTGDEIQKQLEAIFGKIGDDMAAAAFTGLDKFQKVGEGLFETLTRLAQEFVATDAIARLLGKDVSTAFGAVGFASIAARDNLVQLFGGIEEMSTSVQKFFDLFYTDGERLALSIGSVKSQFDALGIAVPPSDAAFRKLVEAQDLSTEAGRAMFASLVQLAPAFHTITAAAEEIIQKLRDLKQSSYEFRMANAQRINSYGGQINIGAIATGRMGDLRTSIEAGRSNGNSPEQRIADINNYLGALDAWVSSEAAQAQANAQSASAIAQAQAAATQARIAGLQQELAIAQQWAGILNSAQQAIDKMRLTTANPLGALGRQSLAGDDVNALLGQYRGASGATRQSLANQLLAAVNTRQGLNETAFQRPSDAYLAAYNENMAILSEIKDDAKTEAEKQTDLQSRIAALTEQANGYQAASAMYAEQAAGALGAIHTQARELAIWAQDQYDLAAGEQEALLQAQLQSITGGLDISLYQAKVLNSVDATLISIDNKIGAFLSGNTGPAATTTTVIGQGGGGNGKNTGTGDRQVIINQDQPIVLNDREVGRFVQQTIVENPYLVRKSLESV